jgi:hypothetical protein
VGVEPDQVERKAHAEGVHAAALREVQRAVARQLGEPGEAAQAGHEAAGLGDAQAARERAARQRVEARVRG